MRSRRADRRGDLPREYQHALGYTNEVSHLHSGDDQAGLPGSSRGGSGSSLNQVSNRGEVVAMSGTAGSVEIVYPTSPYVAALRLRIGRCLRMAHAH